jgi:hypothetical protein
MDNNKYSLYAYFGKKVNLTKYYPQVRTLGNVRSVTNSNALRGAWQKRKNIMDFDSIGVLPNIRGKNIPLTEYRLKNGKHVESSNILRRNANSPSSMKSRNTWGNG